MCLGYLFVKVAGLGQAVIAPDLTREFGLAAPDLGLLASAYLWGYAAIQIPTGVLADTLGPRRTVALFMALAAVGTVLFASAGSLQIGVLGRALMGIGTGIVYVCGAKLLTQWFRPDQFATLNGVLVTVGYSGALLAAGPLAASVEALGWRASFGVVAGLAALVALLVLVAVRDGPRESAALTPAATAVNKPVRPALRQTARQILLNRNLWLLAVYALTSYGALMAVQGLWAVPFLMDVRELSRQDASNMITLWPLGLILGCPLVGYLSDRVLRTRKWVLVGGGVLLGAPLLAILIAPTGLPLWALASLFFVCGLGNSTMPVSYALLTDATPKEIAGTAIGFYNIWFSLGGAVYQQITSSVLGSSPAAGAQGSLAGYQSVFLLCVIGCAIGALAVTATRESRPTREPAKPQETLRPV